MSNYYDDDAIRRREDRLEKMRREKERQQALRKNFKWIVAAVVVIVTILILLGIVNGIKHFSSNKKLEKNTEKEEVNSSNISSIVLESEIDDTSRKEFLEEQQREKEELEKFEIDTVVYSAHTTEATGSFSEEVVSEYGIVVDINTGEIILQKGYKDRISPASMTKILTVLTAVDYIDNLDDTIEITTQITDYGYRNDCMSAGFANGEVVTVRDLLYGTVLPSGADAAVGLATYVAGSQEAFVELMNDKVKQLGLSETSHFTNCVGVYDDNLYSSTYDIAMILASAVNNPLLREVLSARTFTTSITDEHPEGIILSNWFLRRIEDKDTGGDVVCAKTGFVVQSKNCAASYQVYDDGREYVCVTAGSTSSWRCIYDHVELYNQCK